MGNKETGLKKILVTGANGLLAGNVILELLKRKYAVRGTLRNNNKLQIPPHPNLELFTGDIRDDEFLEKATSGCYGVIHIAALTSQEIPKFEPYKKMNIDAVSSILNASIRNKVKRFVFVGSANAFGYGSLANPGNESKQIRKPFSRSFYSTSKLEAQKRVLALKNKLHVAVINPTFMIGPYDGKPSSGKIILIGMKKRVLFYPPGGKNFVHAGDVAIGAVKALESKKNGECYLLAGDNISFKEFYKKLHRQTGYKPHYIPVPGFILWLAGVVGNGLQSLGMTTNISPCNMKMLCINNYYDNQKAKQQLGVDFRTVDEAIRDALEWFRKKKML